MICRASWRPLGDRACRAIAAAVALLLCSIGVGRLLATISRWLTCSHLAGDGQGQHHASGEGAGSGAGLGLAQRISSGAGVGTESGVMS